MDPIAIRRSDVGEKKFAEIARLGGFGAIGIDEGGLDPNSTLDLTGVLDPENKAVSDEDRKKIKALLGGATVKEVAEAPKK